MDETDPELSDYEIPFKGIVEQSLAGIYILQDGRYQYVNETFASMCGIPRARMVGELLSHLVAPHQLDALMAQYDSRIRGERPDTFVVHTRKPDGTRGYVEIHGTTVIYRNKPAIVGVGIDITDRIRRQEEITRSRAQLRDLMLRLHSVREKERARVAQELHDEVGGMLTAMKFDISRLSRGVRRLGGAQPCADSATLLPPPTVESLVETSDQLTELVQEAIEAVRRIAEGLRPSSLDHLGLRETLAQDLGQFERRFGIQSRFESQNGTLSADLDRQLGVYRIFQEALTNVARHANASEVTVNLAWDGEWLTLEVRDNGVGLPDRIGTETGLGLLGMRERARDLNGQIDISRHPGGGTQVRLRVPYIRTVAGNSQEAE